MSKKVLIIAEAGVNHNGRLDFALELIDIASEAGADFVKFQTFKAEKLVNKKAPKAEYQTKNMGPDPDNSQYNMLKRLELSDEEHVTLLQYAQDKNINFLSTPFDIESANYLNELAVPFFKIPSGEITNRPYLEHIAQLGKPIILSTGMADIKEVKEAVNIFKEGGIPKSDITVLHCNTEYPTPMQDVNLLAMLSIAKELGVKTGYSDHTLGIEVPIAAVSLGATVIEKHFTIDKNLPGPDHKASLAPDELKAMVRAIKNIELALSGNGTKAPSPSEFKNRIVARKSIVAARKIRKGEKFDASNLTTKRPGSGISPMRWHDVMGQCAKRHFQVDELIEL